MAEDRGVPESRIGKKEEIESMFTKKTVRDVDVNKKRVLVRVDFNVPIRNGEVEDDTRIRSALPTIEYLRENGAKVILVTHLGRPKGEIVEEFRLDPVADYINEVIGLPLKKLDTSVGDEVDEAVEAMEFGDVLLLENIRFYPGESTNDSELARKLASLADIYVNDAFGTSHRAHASVVGVTEFLPSVAGFLLESEIDHLENLMKSPRHPFFAVLGGNKVSDKIGVIEKLLDNVDGILTGGGMCFTFLKAKGLSVGDSLVEEEQLGMARVILKKAQDKGVSFYLPSDVIIAKEISAEASSKVVTVDNIPDGWMGLDIGPQTIDIYRPALARASTIFWNGPMGVFEIETFSEGTLQVAKAIAEQTKKGALSIVGGGDSDAALKRFGLEDNISFVSTGGGASMKVLEGVDLPGVMALEDKG